MNEGNNNLVLHIIFNIPYYYYIYILILRSFIWYEGIHFYPLNVSLFELDCWVSSGVPRTAGLGLAREAPVMMDINFHFQDARPGRHGAGTFGSRVSRRWVRARSAATVAARLEAGDQVQRCIWSMELRWRNAYSLDLQLNFHRCIGQLRRLPSPLQKTR